ncbi:MAG TPA: manganese efflux pump MntP family protein [Eubacteriales bacterium]|nr:manganese efflux pump MntP family protein [Clostridia bacterium]HRR90206.1 manganese efflux pump MntP family protein [Eubacteriales bacterium]HRU84417.1 manganese efflux pump MntP family protein [Eubacteriales bacterium]
MLQLPRLLWEAQTLAAEYLALFLLALGLSADAFAVSVISGLSNLNLLKRHYFLTAAVFGLFQGVMPVAGYFLGSLFIDKIAAYDHYVALAVLSLIGGKMIFDGALALAKNKEPKPKAFSVPSLLIQGVATSIDALAAGLSFLVIPINIFIGGGVIAAVTFAICFLGIFLGHKCGRLLKNKTPIAEIIGGVILIGIGIRIVLSHVL